MFVLFILMIFGMGPSNANERLDITFAMRLAYEKHPNMLEARAMLKGSRADLNTTRQWLNPEVSFEIGGFKKNDAGKRRINMDTFEVRQPFEPLGVNYLKSKISSNDIKIQEEQLRMVWAHVYEDIWQQYSEIMMHVKKLELAQQNLETMRLFYGKVQMRYQGGQILKNELQRGKIELLKAEEQWHKATMQVKLSKARLNVSLGRSVDYDFDITENLTETALNLNLEDIKSKALARRPDIKSALYKIESSEKNVTKESLARLPSYYVGFQKSDKDYDQDYAITFGFSVPFWGFNQGNVDKAKALREIARVHSEAVKNEALLDVYVDFWQVQMRQQTLEIFKKSLEASHELLHLANVQYSEGKIDFLNYLDQVTTAVTVKTGYYAALFEYSHSISQLEASIYDSLRGEAGFDEKI